MNLLSDAALYVGFGFILVGALGAVLARRTLYAAFYLSVVGVGTAIFMAILGYTYLALFHLLIYVGATVSFLAFTVLMVEAEAEPPPRHSILRALVAVAIATVLVYPLYLAIPVSMPRVQINLQHLVNTLAESFDYPVVITLIALAAVLIEAVAVARSGGGESGS